MTGFCQRFGSAKLEEESVPWIREREGELAATPFVSGDPQLAGGSVMWVSRRGRPCHYPPQEKQGATQHLDNTQHCLQFLIWTIWQKPWGAPPIFSTIQMKMRSNSISWQFGAVDPHSVILAVAMPMLCSWNIQMVRADRLFWLTVINGLEEF